MISLGQPSQELAMYAISKPYLGVKQLLLSRGMATPLSNADASRTETPFQPRFIRSITYMLENPPMFCAGRAGGQHLVLSKMLLHQR